MKKIKKSFLLLASFAALALGSCTSPNGSTSTGTVVTYRLPLIAFNSGANASRVLVPSGYTHDDITYYMFCLALTGFTNPSVGIADGQVLFAQPSLNTSVTFTANAFTGGSNMKFVGIK